ncbi:exodeoxyribonuclease III [Pokkaliibacter sp. CJK22405]|uniref:exodeoxyribonuclease III n=1 Tax=Pokkaliibacter sp. CJK22405 TaxID=3384615 RepID=UPI003985493E
MNIISFNINGIRARLHQLEAIIELHQPDVIGLQEIKVADEQFPLSDVEKLGYHIYHHGQKGHYGVAFLSRFPAKSLQKGFPDDTEDAQKRMIIGTFVDANGIEATVLNGYFPQGEAVDHPVKFPAKRAFYSQLQNYLETQHHPDQNIIVMGDFNISPEDTDIGIGEPNRKRWLKTGKTSFQPEEREWYQRLMSWGFQDTWRMQNPDDNSWYSWFDYRSKGFEDEPKRGLRIDHILATPPMAAKLVGTGIDYVSRGMEKPSDHCPIWAKFE